MIYITLQNYDLFFLEVYFARGTPKMYTNQLKYVCNEVHFLTKLQAEGLQFYQKYASLQVFFTIFDQICTVVICKEFSKFYELLFPRKTFSGC